MNQEKAYQLALKFFRAGKSGEPMPSIDDMKHAEGCIAAYEAGKRCA